MGPSSNLILVNGEGISLMPCASWQKTPQREREIMPGRSYLPPPAPGYTIRQPHLDGLGKNPSTFAPSE